MASKGLVGANNRPRCAPPALLLADLDQPRAVAGGIDIVDVDRLAVAIRRSGNGFVDRVLGPGERALLAPDPECTPPGHLARPTGQSAHCPVETVATPGNVHTARSKPPPHRAICTPPGRPDIDIRQFAILFGAKESAVKVLRGLPPGATLRDVTVCAPPGAGPMELTLHGPIREWAAYLGIQLFARATAISDRALLIWVLANPADDSQPPQFPGATL